MFVWLPLSFVACEPGAELGEVEVVPGSGTMVRVEWTTVSAVSSRLVWGDPERVIDGGAGTKHRSVILGLEPNVETPFRVEVLDGDTVLEAATGAVTGHSVPAVLPSFTHEGGDADPGWFVASAFGSPNGAVLLSTAGFMTWWHLSKDEDIAVTDAQLTADGKSIRYVEFTPNVPDPTALDEAIGKIVEVDLWSGTETTITTPGGHHAFAQLPDGTLAWLASDFREVDGAWVRGDKLVERATDGVDTTIWSAWDTFTYDATAEIDGTGWTHCNALTWDPETGAYLISVRNESAIVKLTRTGEVLWIFGGTTSDFEIEGERPLLHQHRARLYDDGASLLVFDNGGASSRVVEYTLDEGSGTATEVHAVDPGLWGYSLGDAERLENGDRVVTWGTAGVFSANDAAGVELWSLAGDIGNGFGFGQFLPDGAGLGY